MEFKYDFCIYILILYTQYNYELYNLYIPIVKCNGFEL